MILLKIQVKGGKVLNVCYTVCIVYAKFYRLNSCERTQKKLLRRYMDILAVGWF